MNGRKKRKKELEIINLPCLFVQEGPEEEE